MTAETAQEARRLDSDRATVQGYSGQRSTTELAVSGPQRGEHGRLVPGTGSLNPGGRPKSAFSLSGWAQTQLAEDPELRERWIAICKESGDETALKALVHLANRGYGMPTQSIELSGADGGPIELAWGNGEQA